MKLELKKIKEQRQEWIDAINRNDVEGVVSYLSKDAVWMPTNMPSLSGRDAVAENSGQDHAWLQTGSEHLCKNVRAHGAVGQVTAWREPDSSPPSAGLLPLLLSLACCIHACEHT